MPSKLDAFNIWVNKAKERVDGLEDRLMESKEDEEKRKKTKNN